jgi:hypothetical protein
MELVFGCASLPLLDENDHVCAAGRCNSFAPDAITCGVAALLLLVARSSSAVTDAIGYRFRRAPIVLTAKPRVIGSDGQRHPHGCPGRVAGWLAGWPLGW